MKPPMNSRYAHSDGITDICTFEDGSRSKILTCGTDGDIRVWTTPEDEPIVFSATDGCLTVACFKNIAYVGTESHSVESFSLPEGKPLGVITKFTAAVNHVDVSQDGNILVAGSGDMTIQVVNLKENETPLKIEAHSAPVLSVVIDPKEEYLVSSGCDGDVIMWTIRGKQVKTWSSLFPSSNDIEISQTLCRPSWSPDGKFIAVPQRNEIVVYERDSWVKSKGFIAPGNKMLSVSLFSRCAKYLAAGCRDGTILVWNVVTEKLVYEHVNTKDHITGLTFSKCGQDLFAVDMKGRMISVTNIYSSNSNENEKEFNMDDELEAGSNANVPVAKGVVADDDNDPFDDGLDTIFMDEETNDDDDANEFSISKIKAMTGFIASEKEDVFVGVTEAKKIAGIKNIIDEDTNSASSMDSHFRTSNVASAASNHIKHKPAPPIIMPFTEPQKPFQSSSSPEHLDHRFMVWNSIGIIRNYVMDDDDADAIDIEFHDVSFHNGIHLRNQYDYCIASLGKEAAVFGSISEKDTPSKLMCLHFASWENNKEWSLDLPFNESITSLAVGTGWIAAATNLNRLRIFTISGIQRNVLDIGGQIITISGHEDLIFIAFHTGIGLHGNQHISYSLLRIRGGTGLFPLISNDSLPLSPKSEITWIGFSDEGSPAFSDTKETIRILNGRMWTTFLDMKEGKGENDHFWVTGLSICGQQVRAIKCKGLRYPAALPRPTILMLSPRLPLCEMETEKSQLEETLLLSTMLNTLSKKMDKKGFDVEDHKESADKSLKETLMKLFAMCCKGDKDYRASEYVMMMPSTHSIQVAIKYANRLRKMALTERLTAIGRKKLDEEEEGVEEDDDDFENMTVGNVIYSSVYSTLGNNANNVSAHNNVFMTSSTSTNDTNDLMILEENPLLSRQRAEIRSILATSVYKNPFKKSTGANDSLNSEDSSGKLDESGKGLALIDAWKKPVEKPTMEFNPNPKHSKTKGKKAEKEKPEKSSTAKDKSEKNGTGKKQKNLFDMKGKGSSNKVQQKLNFGDLSSIPSPIQSDDNSNFEPSIVTIDNENSENVEDVSCYVDASITDNNGENNKKRKRIEIDENPPEVDNEKKSRISSKLAAFSLQKKVE